MTHQRSWALQGVKYGDMTKCVEAEPFPVRLSAPLRPLPSLACAHTQTGRAEVSRADRRCAATISGSSRT